MLRRLTLSALILLATHTVPAVAHPHVFIDTALIVDVSEDGQMTSVEVVWAYDEFYSLLILQDMGLDEDADGELTEEELAQLQGWDMKWMEGYKGDLYLTDAAGQDIALSEPTPVTTKVLEGRIMSVHRRDLLAPTNIADISIRAYDPEFYTAYDLTGGVKLRGQDTTCEPNITRPSEGEAYAEAKALMSEFPEDAQDVPLLGHLFAETVTFECQ
ncbi:DUF1007 family protein [Pseudooceanicola sp. MF1-13]|uniref:DUF1007 family protein n=1 Tax=Pseudooceanicola sp. MF1-13 TaxID=3379095 RepID=UPI0038919E9F